MERRFVLDDIPFNNGDLGKMVGKHSSRHQPRYAPTDDNGVLA
jgi:hypothetical protein